LALRSVGANATLTSIVAAAGRAPHARHAAWRTARHALGEVLAGTRRYRELSTTQSYVIAPAYVEM